MGWLENDEYDAAQRDSGESPKDFYKKMYVASSDILPEHGTGMGETLEAIFQKFNIDRPEDFKGHSLSVSDVVVVGGDAYYVDKAGYKPLKVYITAYQSISKTGANSMKCVCFCISQTKLLSH